MIHGLSHHTQDVVGNIDYNLDSHFFDKESREWKPRDPAPALLEGCPYQLKALCESLPFKNQYTSGVLSFSPSETAKIDATPGLKEQLIEEFRAFAYAGFRHDDSKLLQLVEHRHTGRLELHYTIPRVSLESGLYFNPFPPNYDGKRGPGNNDDFLRQNDAFIDYICVKYGLENPRDPARSRQFKEPVFEKNTSNRDIRRTVIEAINAQIDVGAIRSRDDMTAFLEQHGAKITRKGDDYFSFKFPEMTKAIRLQGELYGKQSFEEVGKLYEERRAAFRDDEKSAESRHLSVIAERVSETEKRHEKRTAEADAANAADPDIERNFKETIHALENKLSTFTGAARDSAVALCNSCPEIMKPSFSSHDICEHDGSCGDPVLDKARRAYIAWLKECEAQASRLLRSSPIKSGVKTFVTFAKYFLSVFTRKNFIDPSPRSFLLDDARSYKEAIYAELRAVREDLKEYERSKRAAERVADVVAPLKAVEQLRQSSGVGSNAERMKAWQKEAKARRRHSVSDYDSGLS